MSGAAGSMSVGNGSLSSGSSLTGSGSYAQPAMNNNGCPPFPSNCGSTCATLDKSGCPICTCTTGKVLYFLILHDLLSSAIFFMHRFMRFKCNHVSVESLE